MALLTKARAWIARQYQEAREWLGYAGGKLAAVFATLLGTITAVGPKDVLSVIPFVPTVLRIPLAIAAGVLIYLAAMKAERKDRDNGK